MKSKPSYLALASAVAAATALSTTLPSCSSAPKHTHSISEILSQPIRVRRPAGPGADPKASPGGEDYTSHPLPNARLDCRTPESLFQDVDFESLRTCFISLAAGTAANDSTDKNQKTKKKSNPVLYSLKRDPVPEMALDPEDEDIPLCLKTALPRIPVPREVIFLAKKDGRRECFSTRIDIEADKSLGVQFPLAQLALRIDLPLQHVPKDRAEMERTLIAWALTPLLDPERRTFQSRLVTESLCQTCFNDEKILESGDTEPPKWP